MGLERWMLGVREDSERIEIVWGNVERETEEGIDGEGGGGGWA
jgi:hypothetical protein